MRQTDRSFSLRIPYHYVRSRILKFRPALRNRFLSSLVAVILVVSFGLLFSACSRDDNPSAERGRMGAITFTASGGNPSALTKSTADAFSGGASLSGFGSSRSSSGINSLESGHTYKIYYDFEKGENVEAPQGSSYDADGNLVQSSDTRFSGEVITVSSSSTGKSERLEWVADDKLTIFESVSGEYANYTVKSVGPGSSSERSKATLESSMPLHWHDGSDHNFMAVYPSLDEWPISSPTVSYVGKNIYISGSLGTLMPADQYCTRVEGVRTGENWYEPEMEYAYMLASASVESSEVPKEDLSLAFYPKFSSVEVKLVKPSSLSGTVKLKRAVLTGGSGAASEATLSGNPALTLKGMGTAFTAVFTPGTLGGTISYSSGSFSAGNTVTMTFKKSDRTPDEPVLDASTPTSFTFLTCPSTDITQLELTLTLDIDGGAYTKTLKLKDAGGWIPLSAGQKLTVTNLQTWDLNLGIPLTIEPAEAATTITIDNPSRLTYKWSINGAGKLESYAPSITINANKGQTVALYQDSEVALGSNINFSRPCYVYGNVMSLASEFNYHELKRTVDYQFYSLFYNVSNLRSHPDKKILLPATTLGAGCYQRMFGYSGIENAPELPALTASLNCYQAMFTYCPNLKAAPELPATTLAPGCYLEMFYLCQNMISGPSSLPATTLPDLCYQSMFSACNSMKNTPEMAPTTVGYRSCYAMFKWCGGISTAPSLPATTLAEDCYREMFFNSGLITAPELPATTLAPSCYRHMFYQAVKLQNGPTSLPATTLADYCYAGMFYQCTDLIKVPETLPATTLKPYCYYRMFYGCMDIVTGPRSMPFTTVASNSCQNMFYGCSSMTTVATSLQATTMEPSCYEGMFENCYVLRSSPSLLPATTLAKACYKRMFYNNRSKTSFTSLPATVLAPNCYEQMFYGCAWEYGGLVSVPRLPATTLEPYCYSGMFQGCSKLTSLPSDYLPATTLAESCYSNMFAGTGITSVLDLVATTLEPYCYSAMYYGCKGITSVPSNYLPYTTLAEGCYSSMFSSTGITSVVSLPATTLVPYCYAGMYSGCEGITSVPSNYLPHTTLAEGCYSGMFSRTGITSVVLLPATTLAPYCYSNMYSGCEGITSVPSNYLPATTAEPNCYAHMFQNCKNLRQVGCNLTSFATDCTYQWLQNVSSTGTFYRNSSLTWPRNDNGVPTGWTIRNL